MKINSKHFQFVTKSSRFVPSVWTKYYSLKKKKNLTDFDKFWIKQLRQQLKSSQMKIVGIHLPTKTQLEWIVKDDKRAGKVQKKEYLEQLIKQIKAKRAKTKKVNILHRTFEGANYELVGNVFQKPGLINPLAQKLTINDPFSVKKPRRKDNYIGIELEFNVKDRANRSTEQKNIANALKLAGLARYVDVTEDGSCGWEVRVLLLESEFETHLVKILEVLNGFGFETNEKCGTHIHFDMRNRDVNMVYSNLFKTQKFLRKFLNRGRKFNTYCKMNKAESFDKQAECHDRYYCINVEAYDRHQTLEVRMHQGTLKASELVPWIYLLTKIVNYRTTIDKSVNTLKQATTQFEIEATLAQDLEEKLISVFKTKKSVTTIPTYQGFINTANQRVIYNV